MDPAREMVSALAYGKRKQNIHQLGSNAVIVSFPGNNKVAFFC